MILTVHGPGGGDMGGENENTERDEGAPTLGITSSASDGDVGCREPLLTLPKGKVPAWP